MLAQGNLRTVRFGEYELNLESSELRKHDHKLSLPDQALQILVLLVERPGEIVTREQLIARLWPNGTVVEFDHGINSSVRRLRAALSDSAERPRYVETLPKRGYRFIFPVEGTDKIPLETEVELSAVQRDQPAGQSRKWLWPGIGIVGLLLLAGILLALWRSVQTKPIDSVAILPLVNTTHDPKSDYLSDGISEEIINSLSATPHLKVIARTSAFRWKGKQVDPQKVGRELGVGAVLTGTLTQHADGLVIQMDLVKVADGSELWGARYNRQISELQTVQSEIAPEIANKLRLKLAGEDEKRLTKRYTENTEAYELYLKGVHAANLLEGIEYLNRSIAKDPNFALAYAALARTYRDAANIRVLSTKEAQAKARDCAYKALELDGTLGEAYITLADVLVDLDWDWQGAERALKRGIELNPNIGHMAYSKYLSVVGRPQEALREVRRAEEIDPLSPVLQGEIATFYNDTRQYDRSIQQGRAPGATVLAKLVGALALAEKGHYAESIAVLKAYDSNVGIRGHIGYAYARAGNRIEAERICLELQHRTEKEGLGAYEVAFIDGVLGRKDEAFKWLDVAYQQHDTGLKYLKVDPCLDPLRSDPRFGQLVRRVGLEP